MAKLVCQAGPTAGHEYPLEKDKCLFGRQKSCEVQILDSMASREHFLIRRDGGLFTIMDLESRNGTLVNGRRVTEAQLEFGDKIKVGEVVYVFVKEQGDLEVKDLLSSRYQILEKIGQGGMGIVYKANQRSMDRLVALKVLSPKFAARPRFVEQFIKEARAAGQLGHPNIIQVHDVGSENEVHFFAMEYVDGVTCMQLLQTHGPLSATAALEIARQVTKALEYAHSRHIIHRDVKPDNIMIGTNNLVKLADLGISKTFEEAEAEGAPKRIVGTPHYMAPEAIMGKQIDQRVDLYSLGATLYHLLAGSTPFSGATATDILKAHALIAPRPLSEINLDISPRVASLISTLMAKDPDARPSSATEVLSIIQDIQGKHADQMGASADTALLQRLAKNTQETVAVGNPEKRALVAAEGKLAAAEPPADKPTGQVHPTRHTAATRSRSAVDMIRMGLYIVIVLTLAFIGVLIWKAPKNQGTVPEKGPTVTHDDPVIQRDPVKTSDKPQIKKTDPVEHPAHKTLLQIAERLAEPLNAAALGELQQKLQDLSNLDEVTTAKREALAKSVADRIKLLQTDVMAAEVETLRGKVDELIRAESFTAATDMLDKAISANPKLETPSIAGLKKSIPNKIKDAREMKERELAGLAKDTEATRLEAFAKSLPSDAAFDPIREKVAVLRKQIEELATKGDAESYAAFETAFQAWNFNRLPELAKEVTGAPKKTAEARLAIANTTLAAINQLAKVYNGMSQRKKWPGKIAGVDHPVVQSLQASGVTVQLPEGGSMQVAWKEIDGNELSFLAQMVLGIEARDLHSKIVAMQKMTKPETPPEPPKADPPKADPPKPAPPKSGKK